MKAIKLSRKEKRKATRKLGKAKKAAFKSKKPLLEVAASVPGALDAIPGAKAALQSKKKRKKKKKKSAEKEGERSLPGLESVAPVSGKATREIASAARKQQRQAAREEEATAKRYAKLLGLNKRRNKATLPPSFTEAGFDYILDVCDRSKLAKLTNFDDDDEEDGSESPGKPKAKRSRPTEEPGWMKTCSDHFNSHHKVLRSCRGARGIRQRRNRCSVG